MYEDLSAMTNRQLVERARNLSVAVYPSAAVDQLDNVIEPLLREIAARLDGIQSVLQPWVMRLQLREQGVLLTGMRCCDLSPKNPGCIDERYGCSTGDYTAERQLHAYLRFCVCVPADAREVGIPGAWFCDHPPAVWKPSQFGHYPLHWYSHLMHCYQVVGARHPEQLVRDTCWDIYVRLVHALHLHPESVSEMESRLSEDRIAKGEVVS